ncbi:MAG: hypothetical protein OXC62_13760 [Aestuariivita sp.]|nr:hypothetical protein [Aestuariivita sp.]
MRDWNVVMNNCAAPRLASGIQTRLGSDCPLGQIGEITEGQSFRWCNPGTPSPSCSTLPPAARLLCNTVSLQKSPVPTNHFVESAAEAYDANSTGNDWWDVVTFTSNWGETSNTCRTPSQQNEGGDRTQDRDRDGVESD